MKLILLSILLFVNLSVMGEEGHPIQVTGKLNAGTSPYSLVLNQNQEILFLIKVKAKSALLYDQANVTVEGQGIYQKGKFTGIIQVNSMTLATANELVGKPR